MSQCAWLYVQWRVTPVKNEARTVTASSLSVCLCACVRVCIRVCSVKRDSSEVWSTDCDSFSVCLSVCLSVCVRACVYMCVLSEAWLQWSMKHGRWQLLVVLLMTSPLNTASLATPPDNRCITPYFCSTTNFRMSSSTSILIAQWGISFVWSSYHLCIFELIDLTPEMHWILWNKRKRENIMDEVKISEVTVTLSPFCTEILSIHILLLELKQIRFHGWHGDSKEGSFSAFLP